MRGSYTTLTELVQRLREDMTKLVERDPSTILLIKH